MRAGDAGLVPERTADAGVFVAHVAGDQLPVLGQRGGDGQRAVAGEGADFQGAPGADQPHQERHDLSLVGADLHHRAGMADGGGAQFPLRFGFACPGVAHVIGEFIGHGEVAWHRRFPGGWAPA